MSSPCSSSSSRPNAARCGAGTSPSSASAWSVRTTIDAHGRVSRIEITREPAVAREVLPWIERLIRAAEPYPRPPAGLDTVRWDEIWLIDRSGRFQLHTLSEGQQQAPDSPDDDTDDEDEKGAAGAPSGPGR